MILQVLFFYHPINLNAKRKNKEINSSKILFSLRDQIPLIYLIETLHPLPYNIPGNFKGENFIHGKTSWILDSGSCLYY